MLQIGHGPPQQPVDVQCSCRTKKDKLLRILKWLFGKYKKRKKTEISTDVYYIYVQLSNGLFIKHKTITLLGV
jgi:hypothetical protein